MNRQTKKGRGISFIIAAFRRILRHSSGKVQHDKNTIHLPRQDVSNLEKALYFNDFIVLLI